MTRIVTTMIALGAALLLGCGARASKPTAPQDAQQSVALCGADAPDSPSRCECLGGYVRGDIGDGKVACPQGETQIGRVNQGIEGAVCCKHVVE